MFYLERMSMKNGSYVEHCISRTLGRHCTAYVRDSFHQDGGKREKEKKSGIILYTRSRVLTGLLLEVHPEGY